MDGNKKLLELSINEAFTSIFALRKITRRDYEGKAYLVVEVADSSGRLRGSYWGDDAAKLFEELKTAEAVKIQGLIGEYKDEKDIKISQIRAAAPDEYSPEEFLRVGKMPREQLEREIDELIASVSEPHLYALLHSIFDNNAFRDGFFTAPAGKLWHGAYIGGLAEHTINVAKICDLAATMFELCRRDLLMTAALLHDIGKVEELTVTTYFDYSVPGRLLGHLILGDRRILEAISRIEGFPQKTTDELSHMMLSHHGEPAMGSAIFPKTLEGAILHHADWLESQANAFSHVIEKELPDGMAFSSWIKPADRFLYLEGYREKIDD